MGLRTWLKSFGKDKTYVMSKDELNHLSDAEKGLVEKHRAEMAAYERTQVQASIAIRDMLNMDTTTSVAGGVSDANKDVYLYDFLNEWGSNGSNTVAMGSRSESGLVPAPVTQVTSGTISFPPNDANSNAPVPGGSILVSDTQLEPKEPLRIKPIDVWEELKGFAGANMLDNIDAKIAVLKMKEGLIRSNDYAKKEVIHMVMRLENRKKWAEFEEFYSQFSNTTSALVQDLVNKYNLVLKGSDLFVPKFPDEAIKIMAAYTENTVKLCGKKPVFYVIAEAAMFQEEYRRNDPILLVQSPFGAYWQILGAWDREMILLEEL